MVVSPLTGELIPASKIDEHMRISLLDPKWQEQKARSAYPQGSASSPLLLFLFQSRNGLTHRGSRATLQARGGGAQQTRPLGGQHGRCHGEPEKLCQAAYRHLRLW